LKIRKIPEKFGTFGKIPENLEKKMENVCLEISGMSGMPGMHFSRY